MNASHREGSGRVLVTGATGFVGSHLCRALIQHGWQVVAATRGGGAAHTLPGISMARLEMFSEPTEWQAAMRSCRHVVHLAARVHDLRADAQVQSEYDHINVDGSRFVAEQALKANVQRLLFLSSIKVNGEGGGRPYESGDPPDPKDAYGRSKWVAEQSLRDLCARRGMGLVIIRPPLVYGPGVKANFRRLMRLAGLGIPLPIASIANRRSFIGVSNLVDFMETCLTHSAAATETWLVSDGEDLSTPDLLNRLSALMGRPLRTFGISPVWLRRLARPLALSGMLDRLSGTLQVDSSAARLKLAWKPPFTVDEELARTVAAYLAERTK